MHSTLKLFVVVALITATGLVSHTAWGACNVCNDVSKVACINSTSYNVCNTRNQPTGIIGNCPDGTYCTALGFKCYDDVSLIDCADEQAEAGCGCTGNNLIACVSRTEFVTCENGVSTGQTGVCPDGYVCNSDPSPKKYCVSDTCNFPTCDREPSTPAS